MTPPAALHGHGAGPPPFAPCRRPRDAPSGTGVVREGRRAPRSLLLHRVGPLPASPRRDGQPSPAPADGHHRDLAGGRAFVFVAPLPLVPPLLLLGRPGHLPPPIASIQVVELIHVLRLARVTGSGEPR